MKRQFLHFLFGQGLNKKQKKSWSKQIEELVDKKRYGVITTLFNQWYTSRMLIFTDPERKKKAYAHVNKFMIRKWLEKLNQGVSLA